MIDEVLARKREEQSKTKDRNLLANTLSENVSKGFQNILSSVEKLSSQQRRDLVSILSKNINVQASIDTSLLEKTIHSLEEMISKIDFQPQINVEAPIIPAPVVNIPNRKSDDVNVTVPPIDLSELKLELQILNSNLQNMVMGHQNDVEERSIEPKVIQEVDIYQNGFFDGYVQTFDDGSKHTVTGMSVGKINHKYE